jgi:hypothetical protein
MTVKSLASHFSYAVLRGNSVLQDDVNVKKLVMEDLIRNADILFDEHPPPSPPVPSLAPDAAETPTSTYASLFSPEFPHPTEVQAMGSTTQHRPGLVGGIPTSTQSSFSFPSDSAMEIRLSESPSLTPLLSPLLGFLSSKTLTEGVETTTQGRVIPELKDSEAVETLPNSTPAEVVSVLPTSVAECQSRLPPHHLEAVTIPQCPPETVLLSTSDFPLSSATSLQTRMGPFSQ